MTSVRSLLSQVQSYRYLNSILYSILLWHWLADGWLVTRERLWLVIVICSGGLWWRVLAGDSGDRWVLYVDTMGRWSMSDVGVLVLCGMAGMAMVHISGIVRW